MSRHLANYGSGEKYTFFDYIKNKYTLAGYTTKELSCGIHTPVFDTDVLIRTTWMPIAASQSDGTKSLIVLKAYDQNNADVYGAGVYASRVYGSTQLGLLYIATTYSTEAEQTSGWMSDDQWYQTEIRMSLNNIPGSKNYIRIGAYNEAIYEAGTGKTDFSDAWALFGFNGQSNYWNEHSRYDDAYNGAGALQRTYFYDFTGTNLLADLKPCVRESDKAMGMLDLVSGMFCPAQRGDVIQVATDSNAYFEVSNLS